MDLMLIDTWGKCLGQNKVCGLVFANSLSSALCLRSNQCQTLLGNTLKSHYKKSDFQNLILEFYECLKLNLTFKMVEFLVNPSSGCPIDRDAAILATLTLFGRDTQLLPRTLNFKVQRIRIGCPVNHVLGPPFGFPHLHNLAQIISEAFLSQHLCFCKLFLRKNWPMTWQWILDRMGPS